MSCVSQKTRLVPKLPRCHVERADRCYASLEKHHEPSRQETTASGGRSPEGRASLSGLGTRTAAVAPCGRQTASAFFRLGAPRAEAGAIHSRAREDRRRTAAAA